MAQIVFVRHGQPDWPFADAHGLGRSARDLVGLTARGVSQAEVAAVNGQLEGAELNLTSPYTRALHTAAIISRFRGLDVQVEHDLREWMPDSTGAPESFEAIQALVHDFQRCEGASPKGEPRVWERHPKLRACPESGRASTRTGRSWSPLTSWRSAASRA